MTMLIYENINYNNIGTMTTNNFIPIGTTLEINNKWYRIIEYIMKTSNYEENLVYMVVKPIAKQEYEFYEHFK